MQRGTAKTGLFAALVLSALPAIAADDCAEVTALIGADGSGQADRRFDAAVSPLMPRAESCAGVSVLSGGTEYHCAWAFPYRSGPARDAYDVLNKRVASCLPGPARTGEDQNVNHPDSYELRVYEAHGARLSVSIKDKAALGKTYVFLRVHDIGPD